MHSAFRAHDAICVHLDVRLPQPQIQRPPFSPFASVVIESSPPVAAAAPVGEPLGQPDRGGDRIFFLCHFYYGAAIDIEDVFV